MAADARVRPPLAEPIAEASIRGNLLYAQRMTGISILAGNVAMQLIHAGEQGWDEVVWSEPTADQISAAARALAGAHKAANVPHRHVAPQRVDAEVHPFAVSSGRIAAVLKGFVSPMIRAAADFGAGMVKGIETVPENYPVFPMGQGGLEKRRLQHKAVADLYKPFLTLGGYRVRPETIALQQLWAAASDAIDPNVHEPARTIVKGRIECYHAMRDQQNSWDERLEAEQQLKRHDAQLDHMVLDGVFNTLPTIGQETNVHIPVHVAGQFVRTVLASAEAV